MAFESQLILLHPMQNNNIIFNDLNFAIKNYVLSLRTLFLKRAAHKKGSAKHSARPS